MVPGTGEGGTDVIQDFARTYPTEVASLWLGVPMEDRLRIVDWIFPLVVGRGVARDPATAAAANQAADTSPALLASRSSGDGGNPGTIW